MSYEIPAVKRAVALIEHLCGSDRAMGVTDLSRALDINKNMVFRLLKTLHAVGWVVQEEGPKYRMSLRPFHYASKPASRLDLRTAGLGPLEELWEETEERGYLGVLDGDRVLYLAHLDGVGDISIAGHVGGRYVLNCSAPGKVLLAYAGEKLFDRLAQEGFERHTENTLCEADELRQNLAEVRRQGYALDIEEYARGLMCFAAPIYDYSDEVVGAVGLSVLTLHYDLEEMMQDLGPKVLRTALTVSLRMGMSEDQNVRFRMEDSGGKQ